MAQEPTIAAQNVHAEGQSFCIYEWQGSGPDYVHVHHRDDEAWHVLEGDLQFTIAGEQFVATPGTTVHVPAGVPHTYNAQADARYLIILTPRLRDLIAELHQTPFAQHGEVMNKFESEILA